MVPADLHVLHGVAIALLFIAWIGYSPFLSLFGKGTLNNQLTVVRARWIMLTSKRENRTFDGLLFGHIINSLAFFGSATLLVLAGLLGTFASLRSIHLVIVELPFIDEMSVELFAVKLLVLVLLLTASFLSFTYALRKMIYTIALAGSLPERHERGFPVDEMTEATAAVLTDAVMSFNAGIRGYYFALAALFFFLGPIPCMLATAAVFGLLTYRQTGTATACAIGHYVDILNAHEAPKHPAKTKSDM